MAVPSRRRSAAPIRFNGREINHDLIKELWQDGSQTQTGSRRYSRYRINTARGLRLKTMTVELAPSWRKMHPEAAEWVVKVLPERRTLERDLIANVAAIEPTYSCVPVPSGAGGGLLDRDRDYAEARENYMETWRQEYVPYQAFAEKATEDGEFGVVVLPTDVDMEGCPDFYDRLDQLAYDALDDEQKAEYSPDEEDPRGRYARKNDNGDKRYNPEYERDKDGKPKGARSDFTRDDEKSKEAHEKAVQRYLLNQEQGAVTVRIVPANDCIPYLTRGTKKDRWKLVALVERTLYWPSELEQDYGWLGMGDRTLIPQGFDPLRETGQNGMFYLYTLYMVWQDPDDPKKIRRPIVAYSVGGHPTWVNGDEPEEKKLPDSGVAILDLYESHGLQGSLWWYGGGLHTSDDSSDFYWEPYLWPLTETILGIEGMQTSINGATAVQAFTGYVHTPEAALLAEIREIDDEGILESDGELRRPKVPAAGEIVTAVGKIAPFEQATVSPDAWRVVQSEYQSLKENTQLESPAANSQASGHKLVVQETIAQTAKRHIRDGALDAVKFCGEAGQRVLHAIEQTYDIRWPLQTTRERPIAGAATTVSEALVWDSRWVGEGEYQLNTKYPDEYNAVKVQLAMDAADRGYGTPEEVWDAMGITDANTQWSKILKWQIKRSEEYLAARKLQLAKASGDKLMQKVIKLQADQKLTKQGVPGQPTGVPTVALYGPGEGGSGGPNQAQRSLGGQMAGATGPDMRDAAAVAQLPGQAA